MMFVLVGCEYSGRVSEAFRRRGHEAYSCDLLRTEGNPDFHFQCDLLTLLNGGVAITQSGRKVFIPKWDLMIAHPTCTYLTIAAEWAYNDVQKKNIAPATLTGAARRAAREEAIKFVLRIANAPIGKIAIENPVGVLSTKWREPDQFIQPYEYGDDASKKTCLWLKNLPALIPTGLYTPRLALQANGKGYTFRWGNQTDSGQNREPPGDDRWKIRSTTWQGWADAMADQWGNDCTDLI